MAGEIDAVQPDSVDQSDGQNWLQEVITWFGERGISKQQVLDEYYPDEIQLITAAANRQKGNEYYMQYRIANSPGMNRDERQSLLNDIRYMANPKQGLAFLREEKMDRSGLRLLKSELARNSRG